MPSTATITSFYSFSAGTKARATQVNDNFSVFRGHIIPVDPNTIASANVTYDLGSDPNRWRTAYIQTLDFDRSTSTASATIEADANTNTGELIFKVQGAEKARINSGGVRVSRTVSLDGTNPGFGGVSFSPGTAGSQTFVTAAASLVGSTLTITTLGNPVELGFFMKDAATGGPFVTMNEASSTLSSTQIDFAEEFFIKIYRNTTTSLIHSILNSTSLRLVNSTSAGDRVSSLVYSRYVQHPGWFAIDTSATAGTNVYFAQAHTGGGEPGSELYVANFRMCAKEV